MGHLGTLDPMATGVLPIAAGNATRLIEYVSDETKAYRATMVLGGISDTQDAWGKITYTHTVNYDLNLLQDIILSFTGTITQIPPMYSAVHHNGRRLYELARKGISVEREPRTVDIKSIQLLDTSVNESDLPVIKLQVECSKGTYIRTLCNDIGLKLGTGAYLAELVRTRAGIFTINESQDLDAILKQEQQINLLPLDYPLTSLFRVDIDSEQQYNSILNGNLIQMQDGLPKGVAKVYYSGKLISVAQCFNNNDNTSVQPLKVFKI